MFHVKIEIEQHKSGISLQYKTRDQNKNSDVLFSSDSEKTQFLELFPQKKKLVRTSPILQSKVFSIILLNFFLKWYFDIISCLMTCIF